MTEAHHPPEHLGEECPSCGVVHRVVGLIPDQPLSRAAIESQREAEGVEFVDGVQFYLGEMAGPNAEEAAEDIVLSTANSTKLLSRYSGTGWVVEQEIMHDPGEDPEQVGVLLQMEAAERLSGGLDEAFGNR